jgi:hypothetical protein
VSILASKTLFLDKEMAIFGPSCLDGHVISLHMNLKAVYLSMSGKALSTGTLSLRFMQNAHRAKHQVEVEPEKGKNPVKDDEEWEITREMREASGTGSSSSQPS